MASEAVQRTADGLILRLHVQPGASKSEFTGLHGDRLKARVRAKPVEGAANAEVVKLIAKTAGVAKADVVLIRGATSRQKDFTVRSEDPKGAEARLRSAGGLD